MNKFLTCALSPVTANDSRKAVCLTKNARRVRAAHRKVLKAERLSPASSSFDCLWFMTRDGVPYVSASWTNPLWVKI